MLTSVELQERKKDLFRLIEISGQERLDKRDILLVGVLKPGYEIIWYQEKFVYQKVIRLDYSKYEFEVMIPIDLISDYENENFIHVELLCENNFHTKNHKLRYSILVKYVHFSDEYKKVSNLCYVNGHICYISKYRDQVDLLITVNGGKNFKNKSYIPCTFFNCENKEIYMQQHVKVWGELQVRNFLRQDDMEKVLEVKVQNMLILD